MAIEDAAALGILFSKKNFLGDVEESLSVYNTARLPRATRVQAAAARAAYNINERIGSYFKYRFDKRVNMLRFGRLGFSNNKNISTYKVEDEKAKLTIEEMNA